MPQLASETDEWHSFINDSASLCDSMQSRILELCCSKDFSSLDYIVRDLRNHISRADTKFEQGLLLFAEFSQASPPSAPSKFGSKPATLHPYMYFHLNFFRVPQVGESTCTVAGAASGAGWCG